MGPREVGWTPRWGTVEGERRVNDKQSQWVARCRPPTTGQMVLRQQLMTRNQSTRCVQHTLLHLGTSVQGFTRIWPSTLVITS